MKGLILVDQNVQDAIDAVISYAKANPYTIDDSLDVINKDFTDTRTLSKMRVLVPVDITLVYSVATNFNGAFVHVLCVAHPSELLPPPIVEIFAKEYFGFKGELLDWYIELIEPKDGKHGVIQVATEF